MKNSEKPIANPYVMLREEFDDWAILFNPDAGLGLGGFGLNPTGVFVWKFLDGEHAIDDLLEELRDHAEDVPGEAGEHIGAFIDALVAEGLAAYGDTGSRREKASRAPLAGLDEVKPFTYEPPKLVNLSSGQTALGDCSGHGSHGGNCTGGAGATGACKCGTCGTPDTCCDSGSCAPYQLVDCCTSGTCGIDNGSCNCNGSCGSADYCCSCGDCVSNTCGYCWCGCNPEDNSCDTFGSRPNC